MSTLSADQLAKAYGARPVVKDLSLHVDSGEIVGLLGPNGAGKTTAFYMIVGLIAADAGRITLDERNLTHEPMHRRAQAGIGYLPQEPSIFRRLTVEENILAILEIHPELNSQARQERCEQLLSQLRIGHVRASQGMALSGGERRRAEIARALAAQPQFLLLDEPFAGVDPISVNDIQQIIRDLSAQGIGILITDHNVRETLGVCHRSYIIGEGRVIAAGLAEEILANPRVREVYLGESFHL
jgi:lipopolysaccharide export system ATP-binding protein